MQYRIETKDGYKLHFFADDDSCIDLLHQIADELHRNEAELLQWVAQEIENISLFECLGTDPIITQFINSGDYI